MRYRMPFAHAWLARAGRKAFGDCSNFEQAARRTRAHVTVAGKNTIPQLDEWRTTMKKLILGAALAVLAASPVLAQPSYSRHAVQRLDGIRAQAMPSLGNGAVYNDGQYLGADPDANVRLQLRRDSGLADR